MALSDIWRTAHHSVTPTQQAVNVYHHITIAETGTGVTPAEVASHMATLINPLLQAIMVVGAKAQGCRSQRIWPTPPTFPGDSVAFGGAGTIAGDLLPGQVAGSITWLTANAGRSWRGRTYLPFPSEGSNSAANLPDAGYQTGVSAFGTAMIAPQVVVGATGTATLALCLKNKSFPACPLIVGRKVRAYWTTQRRRGTASGPDEQLFPF